METLVELSNRDELVKYIQGYLDLFFTFEPSALHVELYGQGGDKRIGWKQTYAVKIDNWGIIGFTDEPC